MFIAQRRLFRSIDRERVRQAIEAAEARTSGEIRVSVAPYFWGSVKRAAELAFVHLGMTRTRHRNGVLVFVVPSRRRFVVLGDEGIHARVGPEFWESVVAAIATGFRKADFTGGLVAGIDALGRELASHYPPELGANKNELSDDVDLGPRRRGR